MYGIKIEEDKRKMIECSYVTYATRAYSTQKLCSILSRQNFVLAAAN